MFSKYRWNRPRCCGYIIFNGFQNVGGPPSRIFLIGIFEQPLSSGEPTRNCEVSSKSDKWLSRYHSSSIFKMADVHHLGLSKCQNFSSQSGWVGNVHHRTKVHQNPSKFKRLRRHCLINGFQNGGRPSSWIGGSHFGLTHDSIYKSLSLRKIWLDRL